MAEILDEVNKQIKALRDEVKALEQRKSKLSVDVAAKQEELNGVIAELSVHKQDLKGVKDAKKEVLSIIKAKQEDQKKRGELKEAELLEREQDIQKREKVAEGKELAAQKTIHDAENVISVLKEALESAKNKSGAEIDKAIDSLDKVSV